MATPAARDDSTAMRRGACKIGLSFASAAPIPMRAMLVLTQARKVRSLARYSVALFSSGTLADFSGISTHSSCSYAFARKRSHHYLAHLAGCEVQRLTTGTQHERRELRIDECAGHQLGALRRSALSVADRLHGW